METNTLDRFRVAMKASLWAWAFYWPGGGLLLLWGGLDLVSILVTAGALTAFVALFAGGALRADSSRTLKEFLVERPLYAIAAFFLFLGLAPLTGFAENAGLAFFSTLYLVALGFALQAFVRHVQATGESVFRSRADQVLILLPLSILGALLVALDAWLQVFDLASLGGSGAIVIVVNWFNLLYPPLLMVAARPFREPLRRPRRRRTPKKGPAPDPKETAGPKYAS